MKTSFNLSIPAVAIPMGDGQTINTPGIAVSFGTEYDKDEFMALLPHVQEMTKLVMPHVLETRKQIFDMWRDFGRAVRESVLPEALALVKAHLDSEMADNELDRQIRGADVRRAREFNEGVR